MNERYAFPGGGKILFLPGHDLRGIGIVRADGTIHTFPARRLEFPYWDPSGVGNILTLSFSGRRLARWYRQDDSRLTLLEAWRTSDGNFTYPSLGGRMLAYVPFDDTGHLKTGTLRVIERTSGATGTIRSGTLVPLAWTPDGRIIASPWAGGPAVLWDPRTGQMIRFLRGRPFDLADITWSPDGRLFAALANVNPFDMIVVGTQSGRIIHTMEAPFGGTPSWSPDGTRLAYIERGPEPHGERHSKLHVYDVRTGTNEVLRENVSDAFWVSWSPDGTWLLVGDWTRDRWLFVATQGRKAIGYPWLGSFPRWCCPSSPPISVQIPVS